MNVNRRRFLRFAAIAGATSAAAITGAAQAAQCYDAATLPLSQKNRRRSLGYVEVTADQSRGCAGCAFFTSADAGCGKCAMLNSIVAPGASCNSFVARPK
jgi:hypothetical protein